jgi:hypothetical protein
MKSKLLKEGAERTFALVFVHGDEVMATLQRAGPRASTAPGRSAPAR